MVLLFSHGSRRREITALAVLFFVECAFCFLPTPTTMARHQPYTASCITTTSTRPISYSSRLYSFSNDNDEDSSMDETSNDNNEEETLLRLRLAVTEEGSNNTLSALAAVQSYCQSFPFAVVLPVQPMQYLPTVQGGVDVLFMRKKTQQKGSVDGGMNIYISECSSSDDEDTTTPNTIEVLIKRNSKGQVVSKMFSEKLIVQALVQAFAGQADDRIPEAPLDQVEITSVFHKWLDNNQVVEK